MRSKDNTLMLEIDIHGYLPGAQQIPSPNFDARPVTNDIALIVLHNISLPARQYGGEDIIKLFTNQLMNTPQYADLAGLKVSAHFLIRRDGALLQFVSCLHRAWHAGVSSWQGRTRCNDFSIGIELEGSDFDAFMPAQYVILRTLIAALYRRYPITAIVGHSDIAPDRKTDPGPYFDWSNLCD